MRFTLAESTLTISSVGPSTGNLRGVSGHSQLMIERLAIAVALALQRVG